MPNDQQRPTACTATFHPSRRRCPKPRGGVLGIYAKPRRIHPIATRPALLTYDFLLSPPAYIAPSPQPLAPALALDAQNPGEEFCAPSKNPDEFSPHPALRIRHAASSPPQMPFAGHRRSATKPRPWCAPDALFVGHRP